MAAPNPSQTTFELQPIISANTVRRGRYEVMTYKKRKALMKGRLVRVTAKLSDGTLVPVSEGASFEALRAAAYEIDDQLTAAETNGRDTTKITDLVIPAITAAALQEILSYLKFQVSKGSFGNVRGIKTNSFYAYFSILETAVSIGFKHVADQMTERLTRTFYRGGNHQYRAPLTDIKLIAATKPRTSASNAIKAKLVASIAQSSIDGNLINGRELSNFLVDIPDLDRAFLNEYERRLNAAAAASPVQQRLAAYTIELGLA